MFGNGFYGGSWDQMPDYMKQMMQSYYGGLRPFSPFLGLFHLIIWVLVVILLIGLIRWVWKKGNK